MLRREIVAKAILKRINKSYEKEICITDEEAEKILGCWMLKSELSVNEQKETIDVAGSFMVNSWVGIENLSSTKCIIEKNEFSDTMKRPSIDGEFDEVKSYFSQKPKCDKAWVVDHVLHFFVQYSIVIEWIGDTKMYVEVVDDDIDQVVDVAINEDYI